MKNTRINEAWAFHLPVESLGTESTRAEGLTLNSQGGIAMVNEDHAVRQSILILLATRPGERVMRPDYGCWLHRLVFAPNDAGTAGLAMHYIREALTRWEPRVNITHLDAGADLNGAGNPARLDVLLVYRIRRSGWQEHLALSYSLNEGRLMPVVRRETQGA